jgi:hypothetical protein
MAMVLAMAADYTRWQHRRRRPLRQIIFSPQFFAALPSSVPFAGPNRRLNSTIGGAPAPDQETRMNTCTTHAPRPSRLPILDLIAMVVLAIGVGLASGVVLGGTVLLLSGNDGAAATTVVTSSTAVPSH